MFNGTITFEASIKGNGLTFPSVEFDPHEPGVDKVSIEAPGGNRIRSTVHVIGVATHDDGRRLASKVNTVALDRLCFQHGVAIDNARRTGDNFTPVTSPPGTAMITCSAYLHIGGAAGLVLGLPAATVKAELEQPPLPGEHNYGLFRSARQSMSPVEEFMHLYNILLMIHNDKQANVDAFIVLEEPSVPQTPSPVKAGALETVYTRLRNEFGHQRTGVNLQNTKAEMANRLGGLIALTKRAIQLHP